jgi:hypothetical protein
MRSRALRHYRSAKTMSHEKLTHLVYTSVETRKIEPADLLALLQDARSNNARRSITGMLLYIEGTFFQVLEGDETTLAELFSVISLDRRHKQVTRIIHEPIAQRSFGEWTMGYEQMTASDLQAVDGLNDFLLDGKSLADLRPGRAKKLLTAFAQGRWRGRPGLPS